MGECKHTDGCSSSDPSISLDANDRVTFLFQWRCLTCHEIVQMDQVSVQAETEKRWVYDSHTEEGRES